jgi:phenylpyruvate tautomerase PptA (4-oxalocrotonate tautomerase family)
MAAVLGHDVGEHEDDHVCDKECEQVSAADSHSRILLSRHLGIDNRRRERLRRHHSGGCLLLVQSSNESAPLRNPATSTAMAFASCVAVGCYAMALARIEVLEGRTSDEKKSLVEAVRAALSEALQAPQDDPAVRLAEYPREQLLLPYPDLHTDRYTLVEVTMFAGRSLDAKRRLSGAIVQRLATLGVPSNDVLIVLHEPPMENWAVKGAYQRAKSMSASRSTSDRVPSGPRALR